MFDELMDWSMFDELMNAKDDWLIDVNQQRGSLRVTGAF